MNIINDIFHNKYIWVPFFTWLAIQVFKVLFDSIQAKKLNLRRLFGAGGMPSSHSAIVTAVTIMIGKSEGFGSYSFALALIFSLIVMYDAAGVRRAAGEQASVLNKIIETPGLSGLEVQKRLMEALGHTPTQVIVGALIGIIVGAIF
jgi:hypothetical protein